jgi:hypothetical protein
MQEADWGVGTVDNTHKISQPTVAPGPWAWFQVNPKHGAGLSLRPPATGRDDEVSREERSYIHALLVYLPPRISERPGEESVSC